MISPAVIPTHDTLIHSATVVDDGRRAEDAWIAFSGGLVSARGQGHTWRELSATETVDANGDVLAPGFIDIHSHGAAGVGYDQADLDATLFDRALDLHLAHGTTRTVVSLVSAPVSAIADRLNLLRDLQRERPGVVGFHLEGPFLDPGHRGAHDPHALTAPTLRDIETLLAAGGGRISQVTLAPELNGGLDAIERFAAAGVAVAVGHTDADYDLARRAFARGATILTHAFNAMNPIHHRAPGPVVAAIDAGATLEVIADAVHVHPRVIGMLATAAPGRIALITDAMAAAGAPDGRYVLGSLDVEVRDGTARLVEGGAIAGSTLTQDHALRIALDAGLNLEAALTALTVTPARAIGRFDLGTLAVGSHADAVLLTTDFAVARVWRDGDPANAAR